MKMCGYEIECREQHSRPEHPVEMERRRRIQAENSENKLMEVLVAESIVIFLLAAALLHVAGLM